jgi:hypothetical protein
MNGLGLFDPSSSRSRADARAPYKLGCVYLLLLFSQNAFVQTDTLCMSQIFDLPAPQPHDSPFLDQMRTRSPYSSGRGPALPKTAFPRSCSFFTHTSHLKQRRTKLPVPVPQITESNGSDAGGITAVVERQRYHRWPPRVVDAGRPPTRGSGSEAVAPCAATFRIYRPLSPPRPVRRPPSYPATRRAPP